jgi:hypothetical protein
VAKLRAEVQRYIVTQLAMWERPTDVQAAVKERFNIEVSLPVLAYYDPTNATENLAEKWVLLFHQTRDTYRRQVGSIGISHRAVRLRKLDQMLQRAEAAKQDKLALEILTVAAKEIGGFYARFYEPAETLDYPTMTREQRRARMRELMCRDQVRVAEEQASRVIPLRRRAK